MIFYVRNLPAGATENEVRRVFDAGGEVETITSLCHEETGEPLGVMVVDIPSLERGSAAADLLVGVQIDGQDIDIGGPRSGRDRRSGVERRDGDRESSDRRGSERRLRLVSG